MSLALFAVIYILLGVVFIRISEKEGFIEFYGISWQILFALLWFPICIITIGFVVGSLLIGNNR